MTSHIAHFLESVGGSGLRNWLVDKIVEPIAKWRIIDKETGEVRAELVPFVDFLQKHFDQSRAFIIVGAQGLHELWHFIPYDKLPFGKYPWLRTMMDFFHQQFKESCEQIPDSLRGYIAGLRLTYPPGYTEPNGEEAIRSFFESLKQDLKQGLTERPAEMFENLATHLEEAPSRFPGLNLPHFSGKKESPMQAFAGIQQSDPAKYTELLGVLTSLAATDPAIEGMVARIPANAINEGVVDKIIALKNDPGSLKRFIDLLAPDSTLERAGKMVDRAIGPLAEVINASRNARQRLAAARAARRAARQTTPTTSAPMTVQSTRS